MSDHEDVVVGSDATFEEEVLKSERPVLVDFWAAWCGPCRMIAPVVDKIASDHKGRLKVVKVDVDRNIKTAEQYGIMSIPTLILFKAGKAQETLIGALPEAKILEAISKHL